VELGAFLKDSTLHTYSCVAAAAADVSALAPRLFKYSSVSGCPRASASGVSPVMFCAESARGKVSNGQ